MAVTLTHVRGPEQRACSHIWHDPIERPGAEACSKCGLLYSAHEGPGGVGVLLAAVGVDRDALATTLLAGWPFDDLPSDLEAAQIYGAWCEISLAHPDIPGADRWYLAGNIVSSFRHHLTAVAQRSPR